MFELYLVLQKDKLDTENLNLDGTHSYVKRASESAGYQYRKKGKTSNVLIMTDGRGIPISISNIQSGNHNDLYEIIPEFAAMTKLLNRCGIVVHNSILNADKEFDSKKVTQGVQTTRHTTQHKRKQQKQKGT